MPFIALCITLLVSARKAVCIVARWIHFIVDDTVEVVFRPKLLYKLYIHVVLDSDLVEKCVCGLSQPTITVVWTETATRMVLGQVSLRVLVY